MVRSSSPTSTPGSSSRSTSPHWRSGDDIAHDDLEEGTFDLVHTRLVLEHLRDRDVALARMARALAPGGWLVVEACQWSTITLASPHPSPGLRRANVGLPPLFRLRLSAFRPTGFDARVGHRLPVDLRRLGPVDVDAEGRAVFIQGLPGVRQWRASAWRGSRTSSPHPRRGKDHVTSPPS